MRFASSRFGDIEVDDDVVIRFDSGIPGFPELGSAALLSIEDTPDFYWLHAVHEAELAFLTVIPWSHFPDYDIDLPEDVQAKLGIERPDQAIVVCMVTADRDEGLLTANLRAPVIINEQNRVAEQVILADDELPLKAPLPSPHRQSA